VSKTHHYKVDLSGIVDMPFAVFKRMEWGWMRVSIHKSFKEAEDALYGDRRG
jgi:hypothetical protein